MDFRRNRTFWRRVLKLCASLEIPLDVTSTRKRFTGRVSAHIGMGIDEILHEAAHWLCATPDRRRIYNYGLGDQKEVEPQFRAVSPEESDTEEVLTSVLGMVLMLECGVRDVDVKVVMREHNWQFAGIDEIPESIRQFSEATDTKIAEKHADTILRLYRELVDEERAEREARRRRA